MVAYIRFSLRLTDPLSIGSSIVELCCMEAKKSPSNFYFINILPILIKKYMYSTEIIYTLKTIPLIS